MKKIGLHQIRREYIDFFKEKGHLVAPSFYLVPKNDKSLLLIGAGMAPLKQYFTGEKTPPSTKMATCQKCIRTGDIDNVGKTDRHATFFEMLGNFSFGDYFKKEAIEWAWEFLTERLEIDKKDLWVTVYLDDDEAFKLWEEHIGLPKEKIVRLGKEDNFWELEVGPSGPCSEIFVDRGEAFGCGNEDCKPGCECDRFIEVWNLVFTQFDKDEKGVYHPLPNPNIDTGMGLERITTVLEGANNIFEIAEIQKILRKVESISNYKYGSNKEKDTSIRVITDHTRAMTFLVSDGVLPSNEGRGYVLRKLIRRAARHGKLLGIEGTFLSNVVDVFIDSWSVEYEELKTNEDQIKRIIKAEEDKFQETIDQGISILESYIEEMIALKEEQLSGDKAFKLYDTFGFPLDLTKEILSERNLSVNEAQFNQDMEAQRNRARSARDDSNNIGWSAGDRSHLFDGLESQFKGYETISLNTNIISLIQEDQTKEKININEEGIIVLKETPFYGESGGQIGDIGIIKNDNFKAEVLDTLHTKQGLTIQKIKVVSGSLNLGDKVNADVDKTRRDALRRNHTATHLLHKALKEVLGSHVNQAGSLVMPNKLRFDFTHFESPTMDELKKIEAIVNTKILEAINVNTLETSLLEAQEMGAVGLFEDKYGDNVRIVKVGDYSQELCGGTHVNNTSNIGLFKIISEAGIASGVRRIEAITGYSVFEYLNQMENEIADLSNILKTNKENLLDRVKSLTEDLKERDREINSLKSKMATNIADDILSSKVLIDDIPLITYKVNDLDMNSLRNLGDEIRNRLGTGVLVLASVLKDKISFVSMVTKDLNEKGISAGNIIKEVSKATGGSGGGRPDMAQAGGKDIDKIESALALVPELIKSQIK